MGGDPEPARLRIAEVSGLFGIDAPVQEGLGQSAVQAHPSPGGGKANRDATSRAVVLFPDPAGPSIVTTGGRTDDVLYGIPRLLRSMSVDGDAPPFPIRSNTDQNSG